MTFKTVINDAQLVGKSPAVNKLAKIPATPEIKPAPTKAGINGMKIAEICFKAARHQVCFNLALCAARTSAALASTAD